MVMSSFSEFSGISSVISPLDIELSWPKSSQCMDKKIPENQILLAS